MNVVIFGKGLGKSRQINVSGWTAGVLAMSLTLVLGLVGFGVGYFYAAQTGSGVSADTVVELQDELEGQRDTIAAIRQDKDDKLDALAIRIAQMNARMIRLDALGRRLTVMADLEDGEFDFDTPPAVGGPEEPLSNGSLGAVPDVVEAMASLDAQLGDREAQLGVLESVLARQNLTDRVYPKGRPVSSGWISSYFGKRTDPFTGKPANHLGIDFAGRLGDPIVAVADGVVSYSGDRYGFGLLVEVKHGNGYATRYAHNSENLVAVGDEVRKGQIIAKMGETGRATGPNLHFEVLRDGRRVNPVNFIRKSSR
ncbi:MAG: M23 family metallopeptidase [Woeseiaceae bacterium]|nr:M23 family metallopeptidase [Woeseiaceae bacterium]